MEGGSIASKILKKSIMDSEKLNKICAMSSSIFHSGNRCAWLLKKMHAESILIECENKFQFINKIGRSIFCIEIGKAKEGLGLLRLILQPFTKKINNLIKKANDARSIPLAPIRELLDSIPLDHQNE